MPATPRLKVVLLRHGKPRVRTDCWVTAAELDAWVADYDAAGIESGLPPPAAAFDQVKSCSFSVCSDLPRSRESAVALGIERIGICDALFRELSLPYANWRFPRLPLSAWVVLFRLLWLLGYSANGESISAGRTRAERCAVRLVELATAHGAVVFVGHGTLVWFIARALKAMGWSGPRRSPRRFWESAVYEYEGTPNREGADL